MFIRTSSNFLEDVFTLTISCLPRRYWDVLEDEKLLRFITTKAGNRFVISLDLGDVLHHCNTEKVFIYLPDATECVQENLEETEFRNLPWMISAWNFNRNFFFAFLLEWKNLLGIRLHQFAFILQFFFCRIQYI